MGKSISITWYKDWQFWLLFFVINMSGNLCFSYFFPYKLCIILLFVFLLAYSIKQRLKDGVMLYLIFWLILLLIQGTYLEIYSFSSEFHYFLKIGSGCLLPFLLKEKFVDYFTKIIYFFALISLPLFIYNSLGGIVPYIPIKESSIDGGNIYRVSSVLYTQLYNPIWGSMLMLRNCGPFWEPGAFQGFLNLAIALNIIYRNNDDNRWAWKIIVFSITIITTYSTGGYIVLFCNWLYLIFQSRKSGLLAKVLFSVIIVLVGLYFYKTLDFMGDKIANDEGRLGFEISDLSSNVKYLFFGYGLSSESFYQSDISSASSIVTLFRYVGVVGFLLYFLPMLYKFRSTASVYLTLTIVLILMNEPFLTAGPFWWSLPLLMYSLKYTPHINDYSNAYDFKTAT